MPRRSEKCILRLYKRTRDKLLPANQPLFHVRWNLKKQYVEEGSGKQFKEK